jgi:hypothetical protein
MLSTQFRHKMKTNCFVILFSLICMFELFESACLKEESNNRKTNTCPDPYGKCDLGKDGMINVHIVPHTHDDVG